MRTVKRVLGVLVLLASTAVFAQSGKNAGFPIGPNPQLTPGAVCTNPTELRYPEKIKYCNREVDTSLKYHIIQEYDEQLGFQIGKMERTKFKIDHYVPLCAGGSNDPSNLWPQHESVYLITDGLESRICEKMAAGKLRQADAFRIIKTGKNDLSTVPKLMQQLQSL